MPGKLLQIELNEFDPAFLAEEARRLGLRNIERFLAFDHSRTTTSDRVEHHGLDPWVQWVNVHTGSPSAAHGIKRLGETKSQTAPQIWEAVAGSGRRWMAWGVMNAPMGSAPGCEAFLPDPWSFDEAPHPEELGDFLALPRYVARNYLEFSRAEAFAQFVRFIRYVAPPAHWPTVARLAQRAVRGAFSPGVDLHSLTTLFDYLSALEFTRVKKKARPDYAVIFLNHIAHLQHQFWTANDGLHPQMRFGLEICDLIMGMLLDACAADEAVIVMNGLKQKNVAGQGFYVYRQINPATMAAALLGEAPLGVEPCMTNDAHLKFDTPAQADAAAATLSAATLSDGERLFFVERIAPEQVFLQLDIERHVASDATINCNGAIFKFYELFELVCERTGAHIPIGDVYSKGIELPKSLENHVIYDHVLSHFNVTPRRQIAAVAEAAGGAS
ncbi:MAG: hypothetical protein AAFW81_10120 [Pseudomonadota bacterium]